MGYQLTIDGYHGGQRIITRKKLIIGGFVVVLSILIAFIGGYLTRHARKCPVNSSHISPHEKSTEERKVFYRKVADTVKTENLKENLRYFASKPHVASSNRTQEIAAKIYSMFKSYNFHHVEYHEYFPLLSFPDKDKPNYVKMINSTGNIIYESTKMEKIYEKSENDSTSLPPFLAYGKSGEVKGDLIYANYGQPKDFEHLVSLGINLNATVAIVRYGKVGRGAKVAIAYKHGVAGVLIYGDPKDYAPGNKFPKGRWLPDDGVQRGSIIGYGEDVTEGDPLSNGYPAKGWAYQPDVSETNNLPPIPAQPISGIDAQKLLSMMGGTEVPAEWRGDLNITYKTGPLLNNSKVDLKVNNKLSKKKIQNVCGTIYGVVEPDRYVLLGNHIDAWVFGAVDASSGTTVMMEIARVLGEQLKAGWLPRRTIKLCGWDGEEFNLIGSVEYVEEFYAKLRDGAVSYINIDSAVAGNYSLQTSASPLLHEMMFDVHKRVDDPYVQDMTVFDKALLAYKDKNYPDTHRIYNLGAGSDYFAFYQFVGIPSIDIGYRQADLDKLYNTSYYPMYHTLHDTVYWMENFVDKEYKIHATVAKVGVQYLLQLADLPLLPLDGERYAQGINRSLAALDKKFKGTKVKGNESAHLLEAGIMLKEKLDKLKSCVSNVKNDPISLRMINDKLMQLEKGFTYLNGLPGKPQIRHYIMAPSSNYKTEYPFPAINDLLPKVNVTDTWKEIRRQITITASLLDGVSSAIECEFNNKPLYL